MDQECTTTVECSRCHQAILPGEGVVCFKIPGRELYQFFHRRLRVGDCWERRLSAASKLGALGDPLVRHTGHGNGTPKASSAEGVVQR